MRNGLHTVPSFPHTQRPVLPGADEVLTIGQDGDAVDEVAVAVVCVETLSRGHPAPDAGVVGGGQELTGIEYSKASHTVFMT